MTPVYIGARPPRKRVSIRAVVCVGAIASTAGLAAPAPAATTHQSAFTVRAIPTDDFGLAHPTSLAFSPRDDALLVGRAGRRGHVVRRVSLREKRLGSVVLPPLSALTYDPVTGRLAAVRRDGLVVVKRRRAHLLRGLRVGDPRGSTYDTSRHAWFILDARARQVVRVPRRGPISRISLRRLGRVSLRSIAYNPQDRLLYVLTAKSVIGVDDRGRVRQRVSIRGLDAVDPRAIVFAPSGDPTDDPAVAHLYVADRGDATLRGRVIEAAFRSQAVEAPVVPETVTPKLVQTLHTSKFSPPSPDPAGIAYLPAQDRLLIADSEVEEMSIWAGKNLFTSTRAGSGQGTGTVYPASKEPTGLAYDAGGNRLFVSDDDRDAYFVIRPGADGTFGTSDDAQTKVLTTSFRSGDAEDLAYDPSSGHLFVCDGVGLEVYDINPVDGTFGNGNDAITQFDIQQYGARDCEGLGFDPSRQTLLAVDPSSKRIYELTKAGGLNRIIDVAPLKISNLLISDVALAPTSDPADDPATMDYWVTDRQVDNGADPKENDGKIYELSVGAPAPAPAPSDAPPAVEVTAPAGGATVSGTVTVTAQASDDHGVANVEFFVDGASLGSDTTGADGWSALWNTGLVADGSHVLTAVATDTAGNRTASSGVTVTVMNNNTSGFTVRVGTGNDDADEIPNGTVRRSGGDFELGTEQDGLATTAALRFAGLQIPRGARIASAYVQFTADEVGKLATSLTIRAEASDSAAPLSTTAYNLSSRPRTAAAVGWQPPQWLTVGAASLNERTPNIAAALQEVVDRAGWTSGNALVIIFTGSGRRTAETFEGGFPPALTVQLES